MERLRLFFKKPFVFRESIPIWCWRRGQFQIDNFEVFSADTVLLGYEEFVIDELAAINAGAYYQSFLYLRVKPSEPTGLYGQTSISSQIEDRGYASEEFGLFRGLPVSREEYDDGSAVIDGNVVDMNGEAKLRVRYVTPYNLLIAPRESPINNNSFDQRRNNLLNAILRSDTSLETLVGEVLQLPKITRT